MVLKLNLFVVLCISIINITNLKKATSDEFPCYYVKGMECNSVHFRSWAAGYLTMSYSLPSKFFEICFC